MVRTILGARVLLAMTVAPCVGTWGLHMYPVQTDDPFLALIQLHKPFVFDVLAYGYATLWFTTPFLAASLLTSVLVIVVYRYPHTVRVRALPPYTHPEHARHQRSSSAKATSVARPVQRRHQHGWRFRNADCTPAS